MRRLSLLVLLVFGYFNVFAQKSPVKFGKVDEGLIKMTSHPIDSGADAVILMDYGSTRFDYDAGYDRFVYEYVRTVLVKVFTKDGLEYGDFEIPLYDSGSADEKIFGIKGNVYNLVKGKIVKSKLSKESIFKEKSSDHWNETKISMPDVKVGSLIELTYSIRSPFTWNLQTWHFQSEIPTVHSEYRLRIPEYYDYQFLSSGYHPLSVNEKGNAAGSIAVPGSSESINFVNSTYRWVSNDVPAFVPESYVASPSDYITKIEFELKGTNYPNRPYEAVMGSWSTLNESYLESSSFSKALNQTGYMKDELELIKVDATDDEKINRLINLIKNQVDWNGSHSKYVNNTLRKAWNDKSGTSGDINLMLVAGLRELGFEADPVIISTRGHGLVRESFAISSQFNYVLALVEIKGQYILLDATDKYVPSNAIPAKCLNGKGWRVSEISSGFVDLNPSANHETDLRGLISIDELGVSSGDITVTSKGYAAYADLKDYKKKGEEDYREAFSNKHAEWEIEDFNVDDSEGSSGAFVRKYSFASSENAVLAGNLLYFNPTMGEMLKENPFKIEDRKYPVDFAQPLVKSYNMTYMLPSGYKVEELPEAIAIGLPGNGGEFRYNIVANGATVQVVVSLKINKPMFLQHEYPTLKAFYDQAVKKCAEQVVIKKVT